MEIAAFGSYAKTGQKLRIFLRIFYGVFWLFHADFRRFHGSPQNTYKLRKNYVKNT